MLDPALDELETLLTPKDEIIFLGDYIDRGPDSAGVLSRMIDFRDRHPGTSFLRGNHEDLLLRSLHGDTEREELWLLNGGFATLDSFGMSGQEDWVPQFPGWAADFLEDTLLEVESRRYHFVHAGIVPNGVDPHVAADLDPRLWIRDPFINFHSEFDRVVVFGHTPQANRRPLVHANKVGLDTGACLPGGRLTVAGFDDDAEPDDQGPEFMYFQVSENGSVMHADPIRLLFSPTIATEVLVLRAMRRLVASVAD